MSEYYSQVYSLHKCRLCGMIGTEDEFRATECSVEDPIQKPRHIFTDDLHVYHEYWDCISLDSEPSPNEPDIPEKCVQCREERTRSDFRKIRCANNPVGIHRIIGSP